MPSQAAWKPSGIAVIALSANSAIAVTPFPRISKIQLKKSNKPFNASETPAIAASKSPPSKPAMTPRIGPNALASKLYSGSSAVQILLIASTMLEMALPSESIIGFTYWS